MKPFLGLALLALALGGGFLLGVLKLLTEDIGADW